MSDLILYYLILVGGMALAGLIVYFLAEKKERSVRT